MQQPTHEATGRGAVTRRLPIGAEVVPGGVHLRVWAPKRRKVEALVERKGGEPEAVLLEPEAEGYHAGLLPGAGDGTRYRLRLDGDRVSPDPASRWQPEGPHGPSQVVDPSRFRWTDAAWEGVTLDGQVIYELHIGTFTTEGTWAAAQKELPRLKALGVTLLEVMPVAEFPGKFGWGYDGVDLFAPTRLYGEPDDLRRFIDAAHGLGIGVILDVVYNHLGPDGNYLAELAPYFSDKSNEWGAALDLSARQVRELIVGNAAYWIDELRFDGLRLDATQCIIDTSEEHVIVELTRAARAAAGERSIVLIAENEPQHARLARPVSQGGLGLDAIWNDDFHHSAFVALTGRAEAYMSEFKGSPQELISAAKWGTLFQGQRYAWQKQPRGTPAFDLAPAAFVAYLENHDQVANSSLGMRRHQLTSPGRWRAMTALLLLAPHTPMLFQGQEFSASAPFLFFADHEPDLAQKVRTGRADFLKQFPSLAGPEVKAVLANPDDPATFQHCKLDPRERDGNTGPVALHTDLLRLRRETPALAAQRRRGVDGAVLAPEAFVLRFFAPDEDDDGVPDGGDRLLVVNLGVSLARPGVPEPLLSAPEGQRWRRVWSSEEPGYGGAGAPIHDPTQGWLLHGQAAELFAPEPDPEAAGYTTRHEGQP